MLDGKIIVVTGGAGLLGRCFCKAISEQGGLSVVADLDEVAAKNVVDEIQLLGGRAEAAALDINDTVSVDHLIESLNSRYGRIDAVVNNAYPRNTNYGRKLEEVTYTDFCDNVSLHLGGYFLVAQRFAQYFRSIDGGNIVNMGSIYGSIAPRFDIYTDTTMTMPVEYAAIKASIIQLSLYFSKYFKKDGIRCNTLSPGGIFDHQPEEFLQKYKNYCGTKGMLGQQDIVGTLIFLLSDSSQYLTGQNLIVDDGFSL